MQLFVHSEKYLFFPLMKKWNLGQNMLEILLIKIHKTVQKICDINIRLFAINHSDTIAI